MEERSEHLTVIVGASTLAEDLRRRLVQHNVAHAGISTHLRGLRRSMIEGDVDLVILCIALDQPTIQKHGTAVKKLLADFNCQPQSVRSIGLLTEVGLTGTAAEMGCDVYAHDSRQAAHAVQLLAKRWRTQRVRKIVARKQQANRMADRSAWVWGSPELSFDFTPALHAGTEDPLPTAAAKATRIRTKPRAVDQTRRTRRTPKRKGLD